MTLPENRQFRLHARPVGLPRATDWNYVTEPARPPGPGEILVAVEYISLDPAMRGWMNEGKSYIAPVKLNDVMRALGVGRVIASQSDAFAPGDAVSAATGVQSHATIPASAATKIDPSLAPLPVYLNVLGMTGMTAYFGLLDEGKPAPGETVVVSGAAGAVGATVGQIAKIKGCHVVGIAGGPEKCAFLTSELGFDAAIDYKADNLPKALRTACPNGIDVYFDNVGGDILDAALAQINRNARIVICGAISQYNNTTPIKGPANYLSLLVNRASMKGMVVFDYADKFPAAAQDMATWMKAGTLKGREDIVNGLETFPTTLLKLFSGENFGKLVLKV
ncbi:MAG: NADP-dependent oxidoreductase [Acidocella sp.]|nr:NADP-dependent oxidoreductase [Acidocella sp.]